MKKQNKYICLFCNNYCFFLVSNVINTVYYYYTRCRFSSTKNLREQYDFIFKARALRACFVNFLFDLLPLNLFQTCWLHCMTYIKISNRGFIIIIYICSTLKCVGYFAVHLVC